MPNVVLPNLKLRPYQLKGWQALEAGARRAAFVWPRRAGKDTLSLAWTAYDAHRTIGSYWHCFPLQTQARKAIWRGINKEGKRILDAAFPLALRAKTLDQEMLIEFKNGSTWQLIGSDHYDALVGSNPRGVVFSEYALSNPRAYDHVRPILAENGGWALFPSTPRGRNHLFDLYNNLQKDPHSFAQMLTVDDTGHMSAEALAVEKAEMSAALYEQEYEVSWDWGIEGAFYAKQMNRAMKEGRVTDVPYQEHLPVWVGCDIGLRDNCAWWFLQVEPGGRLLLIDYYEAQGEQLKHYVDMLRSKPYTYGEYLILPHDAGHERLGMESIQRQLALLGWPSRVLKVEHSVLPGIEMCRVAINRCLFDSVKTEKGRHCLFNYKREWDEARAVFKPKPLHDWSSDGSDAFRYIIRAFNMGLLNNSLWGSIDHSEQNKSVI